jgi:hypothetical protein
MKKKAITLFWECCPSWIEVEIRGICENSIFIKMPDEWPIYELDRRELETKGYAKTHWDNWIIFTRIGREREEKATAAALANPTDKEFWVWARGWEEDGRTKEGYIQYRTSKTKWERFRVINWTKRWVFIDAGCESGDCPELGKTAWIDREKLREDGHHWSTHGWYYTEAGMKKAKEDDAARAREEAEEKARQRQSHWQSSTRFDSSSRRREDATILGVAENASKAEITAAFKKLAKIYHPDAGGNAEEFKRISAAKDRMLKELCP